jgi:hypothetical protein
MESVRHVGGQLYFLIGLSTQFSSCLNVNIAYRTIALSSLTNPMPLVLPPNLGLNIDCLAMSLSSAGPNRSFDVSSRVALLIGKALGYANDPRPIRLAGSTYGDIYNEMEELVRKLICAANTGPDSYTYCESTSFAVS